MKAMQLCGFALHLASRLAQAGAEQHPISDNSDDHGGRADRDDSSGAPRVLIEAPPEAVPAPAAAVVPAAATLVPLPVFSSLERFARLVDVAYCVGSAGTGIAPPFSCASRCGDFPELRLVSTWNTGVLMRDSCGYIAVDDSACEVIVAFRGTYSIANTVVDLSTIPQEYVPYEPGDDDDDDSGDDLDGGDGSGKDDGKRVKCTNCTVHMGFLASWQSTRHLVLPAVAAARNRSTNSSSYAAAPYRVHLVGHSLGGAVAALAALEMKAVLGWTDVRVTTFGEPRIGDAGFATFLEKVFDLSLNRTTDDTASPSPSSSYRRVTHKNDPVPLLPLAEWGYRAHAGEIYIAKANLSPAPEDVRQCKGRHDPACIAGGSSASGATTQDIFPPSLKLWELFFAHRDYFWRLGLCVAGGDPVDWGRERYNYTGDEL